MHANRARSVFSTGSDQPYEASIVYREILQILDIVQVFKVSQRLYPSPTFCKNITNGITTKWINTRMCVPPIVAAVVAATLKN